MRLDAALFRDLLIVVMNMNNASSQELAEKLIEIYDAQVDLISPTDSKYIKMYISLIRDVLDQILCIENNRGAIQGLMHKYLSAPVFMRDKIFKDSVTSILSDKPTSKQLVDLATRIRATIAWFCANSNVNALYGAVRDAATPTSTDQLVQNIDTIKERIASFKTEFVDATTSVGRGGAVETIDFTDADSVGKAMADNKEIAHVGVLKSGLQDLNLLLGETGGFKRGDFHVFGSRLHNFKSGMLLKILAWHLLHNKAKSPEENDGKQQMIIFISLENTCHMNMMKMFRELYYNLTGEDGIKLPDSDVQRYIMNIFNKSGYKVVMERYLASTFGYSELVTMIENYQNAGFEVVSCCIDYLTKMKKEVGMYSREGSHAHVRMLYEQVYDYMKAVKVAFFTAAQLNRKATTVTSDNKGKSNIVKMFHDDMFAESIDIPRVADVVIYLQVEKDGKGNSWLTVAWGKHRGVENTPEAHKYFAVPFDPIGGIVDDLDGERTGVRDLAQVNKGTEKAIASGDIEELLCM